ncbi:MAG: hypothetical protein ACR2M1_15645 [Gemmatimonadaceae bacterium]
MIQVNSDQYPRERITLTDSGLVGLTILLAWARTHLRDTMEESEAPRTTASTATTASTPRSVIARPSSRHAAWLLTAPAERLKAPELRYFDAICDASSALASMHMLAMEFRRILDAHDPNALTPWLDAAEDSELRSLA